MKKFLVATRQFCGTGQRCPYSIPRYRTLEHIPLALAFHSSPQRCGTLFHTSSEGVVLGCSPNSAALVEVLTFIFFLHIPLQCCVIPIVKNFSCIINFFRNLKLSLHGGLATFPMLEAIWHLASYNICLQNDFSERLLFFIISSIDGIVCRSGWHRYSGFAVTTIGDSLSVPLALLTLLPLVVSYSDLF
jgi:hypothetical protein